MSTIPADKRRYPPGCPDPDWCRGNRACWWDCTGERTEALIAAEDEREERINNGPFGIDA